MVSDGGSQTCCAKETIQGVPNYGIADSAAEITIMGGALFKHVASAAYLKKRDFHKPDKTPHTYVNDTFTLDGMMKLDIAFDRNTMRTPIYIKMDAQEQLLLSERVCWQVNIIKYYE